MLVVELLSIFAIGVFLLSRMKSLIWKETFPSMTSTPERSINPKIWVMVVEKPAMTNETARVKCRECKVWFPRLEWMTNKECNNPNCSCPEVRKLREAANDVINKAKQSSRTNIVNTKRGTVPTGYDEPTPQYMVDVPDVLVIDVIVPKQFGSNRRK